MKVGITGIAGRMGSFVGLLVAEAPDLELAGALEASGHRAVGADAGTLIGAVLLRSLLRPQAARPSTGMRHVPDDMLEGGSPRQNGCAVSFWRCMSRRRFPRREPVRRSWVWPSRQLPPASGVAVPAECRIPSKIRSRLPATSICLFLCL